MSTNADSPHSSALAESAAEAIHAAILNALPAHIALIDSAGTITAVNEAWRQFGTANLLTDPHFGVGANYLDVCDKAHGPDAQEAQAAASGIRAVLLQETSQFAIEYPCHSPDVQRWFRLTVTPLPADRPGPGDGPRGAVLMHVDITERERAERAQRVSEAHFRATFEHVAVGMAHVSTLGRFLRVNGKLCEILGYPPEELVQKTFAELTVLEDVAEGRDAARALLAGEIHLYATQKRYFHKNGEIVWTKLHTTLQRTPEGEPDYFLTVIENITAQKLAEFRLKRLNQLHAVLGRTGEVIIKVRERQQLLDAVCQTMVKQSPLELALIVEVDPSTKRVNPCAWSGEWEPYLEASVTTDGGLHSKGTIGVALHSHKVNVCNDLQTDPRMEPWRKLTAERGLRSSATFPLKLPSGAASALVLFSQLPEFFHEVEIRLMTAVAESLDLALGLLAEEQQRLAAESASRVSEEQFSSAFTYAAIGIAIVSPAGRYLKVNRAFCLMLGYEEAELLERSYQDVTLPLESQLAPFRPLFAGEVDSVQTEMRYVHKGGGIVWGQLSVSAVRDDAGVPVQLIAQIQDITNRKKDELELARTHRALRVVSHCNETLVRTENEADLLQRICQIAVEDGGYRMAWVGYAQHDESRSIKPLAFSGAEDGFLSEVQFSWDENTPGGLTAAGQVIRTGLPFIGETMDERDKSPWFEAARRHGYQRVLAFPLKDANLTFGFLAICIGDFIATGAQEIELLGQLAEDLSFGIVNLRSRLARLKTQEAVLTMAQAISASTGKEFFEKLTRSFVRALGAHRGFIGQFVDKEHTTVRTTCVVANGRTQPNFTYQIAGTPSEALENAHVSVIPHDLQRLYPNMKQLAEMNIQAGVGAKLFDSSGKAIGIMVAQFREPITEQQFVSSTLQIFATRAAAELERQRTEAHTREQAALLDEARDAILVRDLDHRVTYWNKSAERLYGWTAEEAVGKLVPELLRVDSVKFEEANQNVRAAGEWNGELQKHAKSGAIVTTDCRWTLVKDADGQPRAILSIDTDITERKKIEQHYLRSQRLESIGTLAGGIAHDLNNALAPIIMAIDILKLSFPDSASQELLAMISSSAKSGADMVRQVLSFARGMEGRRMEVQIKHVVRDVEKIANDTFLKHIDVRNSFPVDLWTVLGDPTQLHQVLLNLCVNARDAMPQGGTLKLTAKNVNLDEHYAALNPDAKPGPYVLVQVEDTGTGIPPEFLDNIFDPFFTTKEVGKGTGLGLSTSLGIIKSHGGFMRVYSEVGKGTVFSVYIPAMTEDSAPMLPEVEVELPRGNGEVILVVDDELPVRQITQHTLQAFGYRVLLAVDGADAIAVFAANRAEIAVVLTDMMMPVMDGPATIRVLRRMDPRVRIIGASGLTSAGPDGQAGLGVNIFLPKPYTAETLLKALKQILTEPA